MDKHNKAFKVTTNKYELREAFESPSQFNDLYNELIERDYRLQLYGSSVLKGGKHITGLPLGYTVDIRNDKSESLKVISTLRHTFDDETLIEIDITTQLMRRIYKECVTWIRQKN